MDINNNIAFKGTEHVKALKRTLKLNPARLEEFARLGVYNGIKYDELESPEVIDAVKKAKEDLIFDGLKESVDRAIQHLLKPFQK